MFAMFTYDEKGHVEWGCGAKGEGEGNEVRKWGRKRARKRLRIFYYMNFGIFTVVFCCLFRDIEIFSFCTPLLPKQKHQTTVENVSDVGDGTKTWIWTNIFYTHKHTLEEKKKNST